MPERWGPLTWLAVLTPLLAGGCMRVGYDADSLDASVSASDATALVHDPDAASPPGAPDAAALDARASVVDASPACPGDAVAGLLVHFRLDQAIGTMTPDDSGRGHTGQLLGARPPEWVAGRLGNALDFAAADGRVDAGSHASLADLSTMTMCAWVYPRAYPGAFPTIADKTQDGTIGGWSFYLQFDDTFGFSTNQRSWATGGHITRNAWQHVCASWDGTSGAAGIRLYENGASVGLGATGSTGTGNDSDAAHHLLLGLANNATLPFDGLIDDYWLYARVLTPAEIQSAYACAP